MKVAAYPYPAVRALQGVPGKPAETTGTDRRAATLPGNIKNPPGMFTSLEAECDALEYSW